MNVSYGYEVETVICQKVLNRAFHKNREKELLDRSMKWKLYYARKSLVMVFPEAAKEKCQSGLFS